MKYIKFSRNSKVIFLLAIVIISSLFYLVVVQNRADRKESDLVQNGRFAGARDGAPSKFVQNGHSPSPSEIVREGFKDDAILLWAMTNYPNQTNSILNMHDIFLFFDENRPDFDDTADVLFKKFLIWKDKSLSSALHDDGTLVQTSQLQDFFDSQSPSKDDNDGDDKVILWTMTNHPEQMNELIIILINDMKTLEFKLVPEDLNNDTDTIFTRFLSLKENAILKNTLTQDGTLKTVKSKKYLKSYIEKIISRE